MKTGNIWEDFEWEVKSDYYWADTPLGLDLAVPDGAKTVRRYRPLERKSLGLFREFAALEPSPDAILAFARRYGRLGYPVSRMASSGLRVDVGDFAPGSISAAGFEALGGADGLVEPFESQPEHGETIEWSW